MKGHGSYETVNPPPPFSVFQAPHWNIRALEMSRSMRIVGIVLRFVDSEINVFLCVAYGICCTYIIYLISILYLISYII